MRLSVVAVIGAVVGSALVAGCTGSEVPTPSGTGRSPSAEAEQRPEPTTTPTRPMIPEEALLESFSSYSGPDDEQFRAFQEGVARCMKEAGFEYVPEQLATDTGQASPSPDVDEAWYATWGYGISIDMTPYYDSQPPAPEYVDPNADYVASLSEAGRRAYEDALDGTLREGQTPTGAAGELGCRVEVSEALADADDLPEPPELVAELWGQISDLSSQRISTDPRTRAAADETVACFVAAGGDAYDPLVFTGEDLDPYDQVDAAWQRLTAAGEPGAAELARFQAWERDIAVAEFRCRGALGDAREQVYRDVVREVVGPHREELEALAAQWPSR